jgi:hypothetical protein
MNCSDNYDGGNALGNEEVHSSTLCGSTSFALEKPLLNQHKSTFLPDRRFRPFQLFRAEQTMKTCVN